MRRQSHGLSGLDWIISYVVLGFIEIEYHFHGLSGLDWIISQVMLGLLEIPYQFHDLSGLVVMRFQKAFVVMISSYMLLGEVCLCMLLAFVIKNSSILCRVNIVFNVFCVDY